MLKIYSGREVEDGLAELKARTVSSLDEVQPAVRSIIDRVTADGDRALLELTAELDRVELRPSELRVDAGAIEKAEKAVDPRLRKALVRARDNIAAFHRRQLRNSWFQVEKDGPVVGQRFVPVDSVGLYIPGGRASYPSTVLMNAVPAQVAGVERLVMVTPPGPDGELSPATLTAAAVVGIKEIYRVGGAQSIAALALGTETIKPVDKIVGPGNVYVNLAKKLLFT